MSPGAGWDIVDAVAARADLDLWRPGDGPPGGETIGAFQGRVNHTLAAVVAEHPDRTVLCFTHAGVADGALRWAFTVRRVGDTRYFAGLDVTEV